MYEFPRAFRPGFGWFEGGKGGNVCLPEYKTRVTLRLTLAPVVVTRAFAFYIIHSPRYRIPWFCSIFIYIPKTKRIKANKK